MSIFLGRVEGGKLKLHRSDAFQQMVRLLDGKDIELELRKRRKKRTLNQNSWYWAAVVPAMREFTGYSTDEETHDALRMYFLTKRTGKIPTVRSTTELDTKEFTEYVESIRRLAAENGIYIEDPGEVYA